MRLGRPRRALLRTRVLVGVLLVTLVALAAFDVAGVTALRTYLTGQTDSQLQNLIGLYRLANAITENAQIGPGSRRPPQIEVPAQRVPAKSHFTRVPASAHLEAPFLQPFSVELVSGSSVMGVSPSLTIRGIVVGGGGLAPRLGSQKHLDAMVASGQPWTTTSTRGDEPLRLLARPGPGRTVIVAYTPLSGVNRTVGQLELILVIGSAAAGLVAAGGVAWIMRRGLRPIETMAGQADAITAGDLTSRVGQHDPRTEVGRLGVALNGMLSRIEDFITEREASQEATRRFFADASHELRTPLASLRANAELYQQGALTERPQVDEAMRRITLEATRMSGLVDDMLRLARLDQQPSQEEEPVDLSEVLQSCVARARVADPRRTWRAAIDPGLTMEGDEELLRRAGDNLLANVSTHTPPGTAATIMAEESDGTVVVEVTDDGPGVPAGDLPRIFDRFCRASAPSARPGSGLGLAIVAAVAAAHGGTAEAGLSQPHGLRVTITVPVTRNAPGDPASGSHHGRPADSPEAGAATGSPAAAAASARRAS
jgi:two-component system, OmpR family, sensor kinase